MRNKTTGLILGKIAPFHIGHSYLIETALKTVEELIFVVYNCPDKIELPTNVRANWIRTLYPSVKVIEGWDAPNEHEDTEEVKRKQENYISSLLGDTKITHFISSEYYGEHMSKHLNAINMVVDEPRKHIPMSSTKIRNNTFDLKDFVPSIVYKDILVKVAVLGFDKENIARVTANIASKSGWNTVDFETNTATVEELRNNSTKQIEFYNNADNFSKFKQVVMFNNTAIENYVLIQGTKRVFDGEVLNEGINNLRDFDLCIVCKSSGGETQNVKNIFLEDQLESLLATHKVPYSIAEGNADQIEKTIEDQISKKLENKVFY